MKFSVLLLYPDFIAENYGQETFFTHVMAHDVAGAIALAQAEAVEPQASDCERADFVPLLVVRGWHPDLSRDQKGGK